MIQNLSNKSRRAGAQIALLVTATLLGFPAAAQDAQQVVADGGASVRVESANSLRLLSQRIAADTCYLAAGIDAENAKTLLEEGVAQYQKLLSALRNGDETLGMKDPEGRAKIVAEIDALAQLWLPLRAAAESVAAGVDVEKNLAFVAENNLALLDQAIILSSDITAEYANPAEMTQANAMVIDIAGRQRMLTQKISKEACGVETGNAAFGTKEDLDKTVALFDVSLSALLTGLPDAGIMPPPTPKLEADLKAAAEQWVPIKADVLQIEAGNVSDEVKVDLFKRLDQVLETMKNITNEYREFAVQ
jgi:hypothetical protein